MMMETKRQIREQRRPVVFDNKVQKRVVAYVAAAGAAGAGLLAASAPIPGNIVYTPLNISFTQFNVPLPLDINHDGVADAVFYNAFAGQTYVDRTMRGSGGVAGDAILKDQSGLLALPARAPIGPSTGFQRRGNMAWSFSYNGQVLKKRGHWVDAKDKYLGLQFVINGQTHYGWIEFRVGSVGNATVVAAAYNTIPGASILAGEGGPEPGAAQSSAATLGLLALGAFGLNLWRR